MSRIESGKFSLKYEPVNLPELISSVLLLVKPDMAKKNQTMHVQSSVLDYDVVMGDGLHIQKILMNLMSNAVKYTPEGGDISISLEEKRRDDRMIDIIFQVEDNGIGMTEEQCREILRKEPGDRTGIGIKNVNDRIKIYFGSNYGLNITSELDEGTCVTIRMPKVREEEYEKK